MNARTFAAALLFAALPAVGAVPASQTTSVVEFYNLDYNYIGLNGHPRISEAAKAAIDRYGTTVSASRPVSGERPLHRELEQALARLHGCEDCVALVGGHSTNVTVIGRGVTVGTASTDRRPCASSSTSQASLWCRSSEKE